MTAPRRGRPPVGARKEVRQITLNPDDAATFDAAAAVLDLSLAALGAKLIKGEMSWPEVERAAKKGRK